MSIKNLIDQLLVKFTAVSHCNAYSVAVTRGAFVDV